MRIATAGSAEKLEFARKQGAEYVLDYNDAAWVDRVKEITGRGADVIYDPVGGPFAEAALRAIAWEGRFLVVGFAAGEIPKLPLNLVLLKSCDVRGVFWGQWTEREPQGNRSNLADLMRWCAQGKLSAHIHAVYPLSETVQALKAIADRKVMGKVILRP